MPRSPLLSTRKGWIAIVAVSLIPLLYSAFYLGAFWNPYGHLRRLTVAVVNHDHGSESRAVIAALKKANRVVVLSNVAAATNLRYDWVSEIVSIPAHYTKNMNQGRILPLTFTLDEGNNYLEALLMQRQVEAVEVVLQSHEQRCLSRGLQTVSAAGSRLTRAANQLTSGLKTLGITSGNLLSSTGQINTEAVQSASMLTAPLASIASGQVTLTNGIKSATSSSAHISSGLLTVTHALQKAHTSSNVLPYEFGRLVILHPVDQYGAGLAPYFLSLSLWVGALVATVLIPGGRSETLSLRQRSSFGLSVAQVVFLAGGISLLFPFFPTLPWGFWRALSLIGMAWWASIRLLAEKLGDAGRIIAIALLVIQLAGSGGTYPMVLSSPFFEAIHPYLPMTWAVNLVRYTLSGSLQPMAATNVGRLATLLVVAWLVTRWVPGHWQFETPLLEPSREDD